MEKSNSYSISRVPSSVITKCKPLPEDVKRSVRSEIIISSLCKCVEELVLNSIDAAAKNVYIKVDFQSFSLSVEDDGFGIPKNDLMVVGERHTTSKCSSLNDLYNTNFYGVRGESLASIINVSISVDIISKAEENNSEHLAYIKSYKNGEISRDVGLVDYEMRYGKGTVIIIENILTRYPVRQKRLNAVLQMEQIKEILEYICLINPRLSLIFVNTTDNYKILDIKAKNSLKDSFGEIYRQTNEVAKYTRTLIEEHHQFSSFFFTFLVSTEKHSTKDLQIVYINRRFVFRSKVHRTLNSLISEALNKKANKSEKCKTLPSDICPAESQKYPVFIVNIVCPMNEYDLVLESQKTKVEFRNWEAVLKGCEGLALRLKAAIQRLCQIPGKGFIRHIFPVAQLKSTEEGDERAVGSKITSHDLNLILHSKAAERKDSSDGKTEETKIQKISVTVNKSAVANANKPSTSLDEQKYPPLKLVRSSSNANFRNLKRRNTNKFQTVGKKYRLASSPVPKLTGHIINKFAPFRSPQKTKKIVEDLLSVHETEELDVLDEWQNSPQWSTHLQSLTVSSQPVNQVNVGQLNSLNLNLDELSQDMSPISQSIQKVQLWKKSNSVVNSAAETLSNSLFSSTESEMSDLNNNFTPKNEIFDENFHYRIISKTINDFVENKLGNPDSRQSIKEECKKIFTRTKAGLEVWNSFQSLLLTYPDPD